MSGDPKESLTMQDDLLKYEDFVALVLEALEAAGVVYMVGGAVATWAWGEPRSTLDLDLVVNIPLEVVYRLSNELKKRDILVPGEIIMDTILENRADVPINAIHMYSGYKADLYPLREGDDLRESAFKRRRKIDLGEPIGEIYLHSPEDLIIYKLWYFSLSEQTKHIRDITGIVISQAGELDYPYIQYWVNKKGLTELWKSLMTKIQAKR